MSNQLCLLRVAHPEEFVDGKLIVCVGGGAGFVGSHIAKQLRSEDCHVVVPIGKRMSL